MFAHVGKHSVRLLLNHIRGRLQRDRCTQLPVPAQFFTSILSTADRLSTPVSFAEHLEKQTHLFSIPILKMSLKTVTEMKLLAQV